MMRRNGLNRRHFLMTAIAGATVIPIASAARPALAGPRADLWPRWQQHNADSTASIDHSIWDDLLKRSVKLDQDGVARFPYARLSVIDRNSLRLYLEQMAETSPSEYNRDQQFAYWANLYNALTVQVILDHYPVDTIRDVDISPGLFANGPWGKKLTTVEDEELSLDDIEHRILRPIWKDPRIHYAVNCAAIGCPNLRQSAWLAETLDQDLDTAARAYVNNPRGAVIEDGDLTVSRIYDWFIEDFEIDGGIVSHLRKYAEPELASNLRQFRRPDGFRYDWSLNEQTESS
ncbi:MAG: DUF547 domain-containing protein [Alphaproteobacteria bacterium]|nr:DUF547 domain-containing protein [Alphaproteobacteria bacterium SS10]